MATEPFLRSQSESVRWETVLVLCAILVGTDLVCLFMYGPYVLPPLILLEIGLGVLIAWKVHVENLDREERLHRQRASGATVYRGYFTRNRLQSQETDELEAHRAEERALRGRIAELEDQLSQARASEGFVSSEPSERVDEKEKPEVVAVLEVRRGVQPKAGRPETKTTGKHPIEPGSAPAGVSELRAEQDELRIRRKAIGVRLAALDDAVAQGVLTQAEYKAKRSEYSQELRRIDRKLKTASKVGAVS